MFFAQAVAAPVRDKGDLPMYFAITTAVLALAVFVPSFIGLRASTNANWRSL
jgi:hypothetical protein